MNKMKVELKQRKN